MASIRDVSKRTGISAHTLRYWEDKQVIPPVPRNYAGERDYDEVSVKWIAIAQTLKNCGFPLDDIRQFVALARRGDEAIAERKALLEEARCRLEQRIAEATAGLEQILATDRIISFGVQGTGDEDYQGWLAGYGFDGEPDLEYLKTHRRSDCAAED